MDPKAKSNLLIEAMEDEVLVYDLDRHRAHSLNATAAFLLEQADGSRSVGELGRLASERFAEVASEEVVRVGLERLRRAHLIEWDGPPVEFPPGVDRRKALKKLATVGILLPAVLTVVTPLPAQAATQIGIWDCNLQNVGRCCTNGRRCIQWRTLPWYFCIGARC